MSKPKLIDEVRRKIRLRLKYRLMGFFLSGSGLRQKECFSLRVKDVDVVCGQVLVRDPSSTSASIFRIFLVYIDIDVRRIPASNAL